MRMTTAASASTRSPSTAKISTTSCSTALVLEPESTSSVTTVPWDQAVGSGPVHQTVKRGHRLERPRLDAPPPHAGLGELEAVRRECELASLCRGKAAHRPVLGKLDEVVDLRDPR